MEKKKKWFNRKRVRLEILFHILVWSIVFILPQMLMNQSYADDLYCHLPILLGGPITLGIVFYLNYLWIAPKYLLEKNKSSFFFFNFFVSLAALILLNIWTYFTCPGARLSSEKQHVELVDKTDSPRFKRLFQEPRSVLCTRNRTEQMKHLFLELRDLSLYALVITLAMLIHQSIQWIKAEKAKQKAEVKQAEADVKALVTQISPHFLLNTLNNIYALINVDTQKAQQTVEKLGKMLRHMLYEIRNEHTMLYKDVNFVTEYIDLMKLRISSKVDIRYEVDIRGSENIPIVPLLLMPLLENAFKHGISHAAPSFIHISISAKDRTAHCRIENSNHPKTQTDRSGNGIGLELIQSRLDYAYPNRYVWTHGVIAERRTYFSDLTINL